MQILVYAHHIQGFKAYAPVCIKRPPCPKLHSMLRWRISNFFWFQNTTPHPRMIWLRCYWLDYLFIKWLILWTPKPRRTMFEYPGQIEEFKWVQFSRGIRRRCWALSLAMLNHDTQLVGLFYYHHFLHLSCNIESCMSHLVN